jgi:hypothetical protein
MADLLTCARLVGALLNGQQRENRQKNTMEKGMREYREKASPNRRRQLADDSLAAGRGGGQFDRTRNFSMKSDDFVKSHENRHPGESRGSELLVFPVFCLLLSHHSITPTLHCSGLFYFRVFVIKLLFSLRSRRTLR